MLDSAVVGGWRPSLNRTESEPAYEADLGVVGDRRLSGQAENIGSTLLMLDAFAFSLAGFMASALAGHLRPMSLPVILATALALKFASSFAAYSVPTLRDFQGQIRVLSSSAALWLVVACVASLAFAESERMPTIGFAAPTVTALGTTLIFRAFAKKLLAKWERSGRLYRKIAIVGVNELSRLIIRQLRTDCSATARIAGVYSVEAGPAPITHGGILVRGDLRSLIEGVREGCFELVVVALPPEDQPTMRCVVEALSVYSCDVAVFAGIEALWPQPVQVQRTGRSLNLVVMRRPISGTMGVYKDIFDRAAATLLLVALCPFLVILGIAIRLESRGPILFRQKRLGLNGHTFEILKFRTMYSHLSDPLSERQAMPADNRVTSIGRVLRRTSVDELPQLINIIRGDMSLVGPRPHALGTRVGERELDKVSTHYHLRHRVKPGLTGLAQVNGCRGAIRSEDQIIRRVAYDLSYIERWSFSCDLKILGLTLIKGLVGKNAF
jgi:Undecaprenyl-phosphate glucose phosphotransferase